MTAEGPAPKIEIRDLTVAYGRETALRSLSLDILPNEILSIIGPSNSGKTSFLRALNRMNDLEPRIRTAGTIRLDGADIRRDIAAEDLRKRVGMIFALPNPLPLSIFENVVYGPRRSGVRDKKILAGLVERSLRSAFLWDEVKDRLQSSAFKLSGGQQQRLCIARTLALGPEVVIFESNDPFEQFDLSTLVPHAVLIDVSTVITRGSVLAPCVAGLEQILQAVRDSSSNVAGPSDIRHVGTSSSPAR